MPDRDFSAVPAGLQHIGRARWADYCNRILSDVPQAPYFLENGDPASNQIALDAFRKVATMEGGETEPAPTTAHFAITEAMLAAGIEAYQANRHLGPTAIVTAVLEAARMA